MKQNIQYNKYQCPTLPNEMTERMAKLHTLKTLPEQIVNFSTDLPYSEGRKIRWIRKCKQLPSPHIIETKSKGDEIILHVLNQSTGFVLTLHYKDSRWQKTVFSSVAEAVKRVPRRFYSIGKRWYHKPATKSQLNLIAKIVDSHPSDLPQLTAYNAAIVIDTHRITPHLTRISAMIGLWLGGAGCQNNLLLPFVELESV